MNEATKPDLNELAGKIQNDKSFSVLDGYITERTMKGIGEMGLTMMTDIQAKCIPDILKGQNIFATAKTGSGKTLAFLIPVVDMIHQIGFKARNGTGAIIISPTRELATQTFEVLKQLTKFHSHSIAMVVGGNDRKDEARKLYRGTNILVATPARLLDHLTKTEGFVFSNLELMVIDEADRILQDGFEETMKQIMKLTPQNKQMLLFTATRTDKADELARSLFKRKPVHIDVEIGKKATAQGLEQGYIVCPPEKRFSTLFTLLREKIDSSKIMVFMGARVTVEFYDRILRHWEMSTLSMHGGHDQHERKRILKKFRKAEHGVLLCTDVAARGLDIHDIDWVFQYDPPSSVQEYIHRVGRTARGEGAKGSALLFLMAHELDFRKHLKNSKVPIDEYEMDWDLVPELNVHLEEMINGNAFIRPWAVRAYEGYVRAYKSHPLREVFDFDKLNLNKLALSFGLSKAPWIDFSHKRKSDDQKFGDHRKKRKVEKFGGVKFNQKKDF